MSLQIRICLYYTSWKFREDSDSEIEIIESKHHLPVKRSLTSKKQSKAKPKYVHPHSMKNTIVGLKKKENPFILMVEQSISISILYSEVLVKTLVSPWSSKKIQATSTLPNYSTRTTAKSMMNHYNLSSCPHLSVYS